MGSGWAKLGIAVGGALLGGWFLTPVLGASLGMSAGFMAGSYLGSQIFPTDNESSMPPVHDYPVQSSASGIPIPIVYGTTRLAGNVIWLGDLTSYSIKHSAGGGGKGGGGDETTTHEVKYRRSFIIALCEGPSNILRCWKGKKEIPVSEFTTYEGEDNSGISTLIGENYAEYSNICLAYFEDYELGNSQAVPNFVFEVSHIPLEYSNFIAGGIFTVYSSYIFDTSGAVLHNLSDTWGTSVKIARRVLRHLINRYIYVLCDNRIEKWDDDGNRITAFGSTGDVSVGGTGALDFCVDASGFIYVGLSTAIPSIDTLYKIHPDTGAIVWQTHSQRLARSVRSCFYHSDGNLYISSQVLGTGNARVVKIDISDGSVLQYYNLGTVQNVILDDDDYLYAVTTDAANVYKSNNAGSAISWGSVGSSNLYAILVKSGLNPPATTEIYVAGEYDAGENATIFRVNPNTFAIIDKYNTGSGTVIQHLSWDADGNILAAHAKAVGDGGKDCHVTRLDTGLNYLNGYAFDVDTTYYSVVRAPIGSTGYVIGDDVNFAAMIKDLLLSERAGNYTKDDLITDDFDSVITYCTDNNLGGSLVLREQKPLPDWIAYICSHFQGYFYEIGGKIGLNCYRDQASVLSITQDDLIRDGDEPPIHITKRKYGITYNRLECTWTDRDKTYKTAVAVAFDRIDQRESGQVRTKTMDLKAITDDELASKMTWRIFIDQFYRFSQYAFKLGYKSMLLEIGDVVDVTDGHLLTAKKMRVMSIDEETNGRKAIITAIEDISDLYPGVSYTTQQSEAAGDSDITLADGTVIFREGWDINKLYLSIVPGGAQCNGWNIYRSYDDASYDLVGRSAIGGITSGDANSTGTTQSYLPAHTAIIHRAGEWFDVSIGTLTDLDTSITDDAFFNNRKLARIGNEIIAYQTCVESSVAGIWRVSNLVRGLFGTEPVAHSSGETFSTLDINFAYIIQPSDIGKTVYFKVVSFYADEVQSLSDVSAQSHVISGIHIKPLPVSLIRIENREGLTTYKIDDVTIDWYFCSKESGFGRGGYGNVLWGAYVVDPLLERLRVELEEEDGTAITTSNFILSDYGEPTQLEILLADRNGKNPVRVKMTPGTPLLSGETRSVLIEKI